MINVVVVEDNDTIREGLEILIDGAEGFTCLGAFPDCEKMIKNINSLNPDVLLIDLQLPGISGIEGIKRVKVLIPDLKIIILTVYNENDLIFDALCAGAIGYITKNAPPSKLLYAIREAYNGCTPMSSNIARKVIGLFQQKGLSGNNNDGNNIRLTQREIEILSRLVEGSSFKAIADSLLISLDNLRSDFKNIYEKLHIYYRSENSMENN